MTRAQEVQVASARVRTAMCEFEGQWYHPVDPMPDCDELREFDRLVLQHEHDNAPKLFWVRAEMLWSGWVVGISLRRGG